MKIALTFDIERDIPNFLDTYFGVKIGLIKILLCHEVHAVQVILPGMFPSLEKNIHRPNSIVRRYPILLQPLAPIRKGSLFELACLYSINFPQLPEFLRYRDFLLALFPTPCWALHPFYLVRWLVLIKLTSFLQSNHLVSGKLAAN